MSSEIGNERSEIEARACQEVSKHGAPCATVLDYPSRDSTGISKAYEPGAYGPIGMEYRFPLPKLPTADS